MMAEAAEAHRHMGGRPTEARSYSRLEPKHTLASHPRRRYSLVMRISENSVQARFEEFLIPRTRVNRGKKGRACYTPARTFRPSHVGKVYVGGRVGVYVVDGFLIERLLE